MRQLDVVAGTYRVRVESSEGTMFALDFADQQYLITARHVVANLRDVLEIEWERGWRAVPVELIGHGNGDIDISVLHAQQRFPDLLRPGWKSPQIEPDLKLGEDVRFYGFPYGWRTSRGQATVPVPLVKAGIVSGFFGPTALGPKSSFFVDGHNNPGFSGGPLVSVRHGQYRIAGVVTAYLPYEEEVQSLTSDGDSVGFVKQNSGIMLAWNIQHAIDIIVGASVSESA